MLHDLLERGGEGGDGDGGEGRAGAGRRELVEVGMKELGRNGALYMAWPTGRPWPRGGDRVRRWALAWPRSHCTPPSSLGEWNSADAGVSVRPCTEETVKVFVVAPPP